MAKCLSILGLLQINKRRQPNLFQNLCNVLNKPMLLQWIHWPNLWTVVKFVCLRQCLISHWSALHFVSQQLLSTNHCDPNFHETIIHEVILNTYFVWWKLEVKLICFQIFCLASNFPLHSIALQQKVWLVSAESIHWFLTSTYFLTSIPNTT